MFEKKGNLINDTGLSITFVLFSFLTKMIHRPLVFPVPGVATVAHLRMCLFVDQVPIGTTNLLSLHKILLRFPKVHVELN